LDIELLYTNITHPNDNPLYQKITSHSSRLEKGAPYDYTSIMHYGAYFFSKNNLKTLTTVGKPGGSDALDQTLGTHDDLSTGDKLQLKLLYREFKFATDMMFWGASRMPVLY
jgi:hypothetical protein